jgi:hypothetical protein
MFQKFLIPNGGASNTPINAQEPKSDSPKPKLDLCDRYRVKPPSRSRSKSKSKFSSSKFDFPQDWDLEIHIDWLTLRFKMPNLDRFKEFLGDICNWTPNYDIPIFSLDKAISDGHNYYQNSVSSVRKIRGGWSVLENGVHDCYLSLSGDWLSPLGFAHQVAVLRHAVKEFRARVTRIDLTIDDYSRSVLPSDLLQLTRDDYHSGFTVYQFALSKKKNQAESDTFYMGSRKSPKYLRAYDAFIKHCINAIRWELELKNSYAQQFVDTLLFVDLEQMYSKVHYTQFDKVREDYLQTLAQVVGACVAGSFAFYQETGEVRKAVRHNERFEYMPWYQSFVDACGGRLKITAPQLRPALEKTISWFHRQVAPSLAIFFKGLERHDFNSLINKICNGGSERFGIYHNTVVEYLRRNGSLFSFS